VQIDIKTTSITPIRQTFSYTARRIGNDKAASRYQEAMYELQPEVNFHYRPLWDPGRDIYDKRRTRLVMADWYAFKDPRQFYYGTYTTTRARQQDAAEKHFEFVDKRGLLRNLPDADRARLAFCLVPLRHVEWGANMNNTAVTSYAWGSAITQATMYHTMDRLGLAQYLSRIGLLLDGNSGDALSQGKTDWMEHADWQPLRRFVEDQLVIDDCMELFFSQNLVLDGLLYPLVFQRFDARVSAQHGPALSLCTEFFGNWFDETRRWVDAVLKTAVSESADNAALVSGWYRSQRNAAAAALMPYARHLLGDEAEAELAAVVGELDARVAKQGLRTQGEGA
jgi:phenol hydroxylase P1 protein